MYAKVFRALWDGTLGADWASWSVFVFLLAHCDQDGNVDMSHKAIAARSGIPIDMVRSAIEILEAPDPESRSPEKDGRRLERIDPHRSWGWHIVNYEHYRSLRDMETVRAQTRERVRRHRFGNAHSNAPVTPSNAPKRHAEAEAEGEVDAKTKKDTVPAPRALRANFVPPSIDDVKAYCLERHNVVDPVAWIDHYEANGWRVGKNPMRSWKAAVRTWEKNGIAPPRQPQASAPDHAPADRSKLDEMQDWRRKWEEENAGTSATQAAPITSPGSEDTPTSSAAGTPRRSEPPT